MLLPVNCPCCGKKFWIETSIDYQEFVYLNSLEELRKYVLKEMNIIKTWEEEEIGIILRKEFMELIKAGNSLEQSIKIISQVYGVPVLALEELLSDLIEEVKVSKA